MTNFGIDSNMVFDANGKSVTTRLSDHDILLNNYNTSLNKNTNILSSMRDPLAYLNSVEILCSFSARGQSTDAWIQGFSINESTNEIYVAIQRNDGTTGLTIEVRNMDGSFKASKNLPIESGAFTESLPFFYNGNNELCFIVRTQTISTVAIYNYTLGTLGTPFALSGTPYKSALDGDYFITCDATSSAPYTLKTIYVYDFPSIKSGTPTLLNSFRIQNYGSELISKAQGIALNNGYIFLSHGESGGYPAVSVYNTAGQLVSSYVYTKESLAKAVNTYYPNTLTDLSGYAYENESTCAYKGKLVTAQLLNSVVYLFMHNSPSGVALETKVPIYRIDSDWQPVTLLNGAIQYASDTPPRIRRIGNIICLNGAVKGLSVLNQEVLDFGIKYAPDYNIPFSSATSSSKQCNWTVKPNGRALVSTSENGTLDTGQWYPFNFMWMI
jgi:hypothetical protein